METIINLSNLKKNYTYYRKKPGMLASLKSLFKREKLQVDAIKGISFKIKKGELVGFIGPNGAGKTTTLKMLSGILYPTAGEAKVLGFTPWQRQKKFQKQFALIMGQKSQLWWDLPPMESFILNKEIYEVSDKEFNRQLEELVSLLDIKDILDIQVRKLSLGQRLKCELVAALLHNPRVLFLDEPTIGLDVVAQKNIRDFIKKYNREKKTTIILTSHYMEDIKELCQRVIIINVGEIIYDGSFDNLIKKYATEKELKITFGSNAISKNELEKYGRLKEFTKHAAILKVPREKSKAIAASILNSKLLVDDILIAEMDISEVIRKIFKNFKP